MRKLGRARGIGLTVLLAAALVLPSTGMAVGNQGFSAGETAGQRAVEQRFRAGIDPEQARELSTALSSRPQLVGTKGNRESADYSMAKLREWGLKPKMDSYSVYASVPKRIGVTMTAPNQQKLSVMEQRRPGQQRFEENVPGYIAYSPPGNVTSDVVYANYGLPDDYAKLEKLGIDVRGKIMLVRYGNSFRGVKTRVAAEHGAKGVIIYSDPADDGFSKGPVYPNGPFRPADAIQRGSGQDQLPYPGDPLTPGKPAIPGTDRLDPAQAKNMGKIPTTPISYGEAEKLLRALRGPQVPKEWQGGLRFPYHIGPGPTKVNMDLDIDYQRIPVNNLITEIPGAKHPEQKIVIGAHYDGWTYGTNDNTSAWVATMQIGYGLSRLLRAGWRPDRTIVLAGWDGEEYGLLGSTEFAEHYSKDLTKNAVANLNMDGVAGSEFSAKGVPSLDAVLTDVTKDVRDPKYGTVYDNWVANAEDGKPEIKRLGSGSDYAPFLDHLGIAAANPGFSPASGESGEYHSTIDNLDMTGRFLDPGFRYHSVAAQVTGSLGLRLAQSDKLPMRYSDYAGEIGEYLDAAGKRGLDVTEAKRTAEQWATAARGLENAAPSERINRVLIAQERALLAPGGLPDREWFRHQIYVAAPDDGYGVQKLPGINASLDKGDRPTAQRYLDSLTRSLRQAAELANRAVS